LFKLLKKNLKTDQEVMISAIPSILKVMRYMDQKTEKRNQALKRNRRRKTKVLKSHFGGMTIKLRN
jgi:hypothetical protein